MNYAHVRERFLKNQYTYFWYIFVLKIYPFKLDAFDEDRLDKV